MGKVFVPVLQEILSKWEERRASNAMRGKRVAADQVDVSLYKTQESYADKFEELDWFPLDSYIVKVGGDLPRLKLACPNPSF